MGTGSLIKHLSGWRSTHFGRRVISQPGECRPGPPPICPILAALNYTETIALPHTRFNFGLVWLHLGNEASVNVNRRRNAGFLICTDNQTEACGTTADRDTSPAVDRFSRGFIRAFDADLSNFAHMVTASGGNVTLRNCWIDNAGTNKGLKVQWHRHNTSPLNYELKKVYVNYWVFEY